MFIKFIFFYQRGDDDDDGDMDSYQVLLLLLLSNHIAWGTANANSYQLQKVTERICSWNFMH